MLRLTLEETFAGVDDAVDWRAAYEMILRSLSGTLVDRGRCVAFHLAYGVSTGTPRALEAVRGYFAACRRRLAETLSAVVEPGEADRIAVDALSRIEGATLWLATDGDKAAMQRTVACLLAEVDRLPSRPSRQSGTEAYPKA